MNDTAKAFLIVAEQFEIEAKCEPDWNHAQYLRDMANVFKNQAARLGDLKENDNANGNQV